MQNNMGTLKFSDGVEINTSGKLRPLRLKDGWYAVANGMCIPTYEHCRRSTKIHR